jgi:hypothetical protein
MKLRIFYFSDIDDTDTWTSEIDNIHAVAWQGDRPDNDMQAAGLTTADGGVVTFDGASNKNGWLWVLSGS